MSDKEGKMDFERRHDAYMDFVRKNAESISTSIFWNQLRHEFTTTFIDGKAEVTGWRGKIYDPRTGEYNKTLRKRDKLFILLSRVADFWSRKFFSMALARYRYEKAYAKLNCDENLPKNCRLYLNSVFKVGKNCAFHPHLFRMFSYFSQLYKYCMHFDSREWVLEIGGGQVY